MSNSIDPIAFETLKQMTGADFIGEMIDAFLADAPNLIAEMKAARDADSFRRAAHSLKSNAATFGANRLAELAREMETLGRENRLSEGAARLEALQEAYAQAAAELKGMRA